MGAPPALPKSQDQTLPHTPTMIPQVPYLPLIQTSTGSCRAERAIGSAFGLWQKIAVTAASCALGLAASPVALADAIVTSASGSTPAEIQTAVNDFRLSISLGGGNNGAGGLFTNGFRNVNWDGVGDLNSDPFLLSGAFFNSNSPRGLVTITPGQGFLVSADSSNPTSTAIEFGSSDPSYPASFLPFSGERIFTARGSTITDNVFFVPSSPTTAATVFGFGVVFTDVDLLGSTTLEFFDLDGGPLGIFNAPVQDNGLSFLGVSFDAGERVGSVRITSGNAPLGPGIVDGLGIDVVAMDDFMYSEPIAVVPEPGVSALLLLSLTPLTARRRRSRVAAPASSGPDF